MHHRFVVLVIFVSWGIQAIGQEAGSVFEESLPVRPEIKRGQATPFDQAIIRIMTEQELVGAAIAVTRNSKLVYARGFGYADIASKTPVQPTSGFRIASISKPITSVAILQLVQQRKLRLDDLIIDVVGIEPFLDDGVEIDRRMRKVTIRHLLNHTAGWLRETDPMGSANQRRVTSKLGLESGELRPKHMVRYMLGQKLDFEPGTKMVYSNLGYCFLGRVVESVSGLSYEKYVQRNVFAPIGITSAYIGKRKSFENEVTYYHRDSADGKLVDGGEHVAVEIYESHGGWVISMVDLARLAGALDTPKRSRILSQEAIEAMFSRPIGPVGVSDTGNAKMSYYGLGWEVRLNDEGRTTWHSGSLHIGTSSMLYRRRDGMTWAIAFNTRDGKGGAKLRDAIQTHLHKAADVVKTARISPRLDLFRTVYRPDMSSK